MSASVIVMLSSAGLLPRRRRRGGWLTLELRDGWWTVVAEHSTRPPFTFRPGQRIVREEVSR